MVCKNNGIRINIKSTIQTAIIYKVDEEINN